jgi:hypothetical protein
MILLFVFTPLQGFKGIGDTYIRETYTGFKPVSLFSLSLCSMSVLSIDRYHGIKLPKSSIKRYGAPFTLAKENNWSENNVDY